MRAALYFIVSVVFSVGPVFGQTPSAGTDAGASQQPRAQATPQPPPPQQLPSDPDTPPTERSLGLAPGGLYPGAQFITSYDAGQGQRYYLYGANAAFEEVVAYYRGVLKDKGDRVFDEPPVHQFDIGKYREDTMAFPPSITVKDYTWGGMGGYLNPKLGAQPQRFRTIIQIVPSPLAAPAPVRR